MSADDLEIINDILDLFKVNEKRPFTSHNDTVLFNTRVPSSTAYDAHGLSLHKDGQERIKGTKTLQSGIEKTTTKSIFYSESLCDSRDVNTSYNYFTPVCDEHNLQTAESKPAQKRKRGRPRRGYNDRWPKRPLSAYNLFFKGAQLRLSKLRKDQENARCLGKEVPVGEAADSRTTIIASKWRAISDEEKFPYEIKAVESMKKYREEVAVIMKNKRQKCGLGIDDSTHKDEKSCTDPIVENNSPTNTELGYSVFFQHERERLRHCLSIASTSRGLDSSC